MPEPATAHQLAPQESEAVQRFTDACHANWLLYIERVLGFTPWSRQAQVVRAVQSVVQRRHVRGVAVHTANQVGKTAVAAAAALTHTALYRNSITLTTAPTWKLVRDQLWAELRNLLERARTPFPRALKTHWELGEKWYATGLSALHPEDVQGYHAGSVLVIVDEASRVRPEMFTGLERTGGRMLLLGNPLSNIGYFADACRSSHWHSIQISALESPNVRAGRILIPGLATPEWAGDMLARYGADHPFYKVSVLGEFAELEEDVVVPLAWIDSAIRRRTHVIGPSVGTGEVCLGVDVARFGSDESCIATFKDNRVHRLEAHHGEDGHQTGARVAAHIRKHQAAGQRVRVRVDNIGVGASVCDFLRNNGFEQELVEVNVATPPQNTELYRDLKAELWAHMAERLDPDGEEPIGLPDDPMLREELATHQKKYVRTGSNAGKMYIADKDEVRRALGRSPDRADAVILAVAPVTRPALALYVV